MGHNNVRLVDIRMFGEFDILVDNKSLFNEFTRLPIIMELLQYMIANYGEDLSPNKILDDIWSDKDYQDISKVLRTYIYRLKQFLTGNNSLNVDISNYITISNSNGRYRLDVSPNSSLDIRLFDTNVKRIDKAKVSIDNIESIKEISSIYRGDFLKNNLYTHWVIPLRSLYLDYFCKLNNIILETYFNKDMFKEVVKYGELIFDIYDLDEKSNIFFLKSLINEGRVSDALQHYTYITSKLYTELHIKPCEELKEIYTLLKKPVETDKPKVKSVKENEMLTINSVQNDFVNKFPRNFKKYKLKNKQEIAIGLLRISHKDKQKISEEESSIIFSSLKDVLNIILIKDYFFNAVSKDVFILCIRDAKENFVSLVSEQLKNYVASNSFIKDIKIDAEIKMVSPIKRETYTSNKENVRFEKR